MLVLRRKTGEGIIIGSNVVVRILSIEHGDVKIGIEAPRSVKVLREELYKEVVKTNVESNDFDVELAKKIFKREDRNANNT